MTSHSSTNSAVKELTSNDLAGLCSALNEVAPKCFELGLQLGVKKANIDIIIKNNKNDCQAQLCEIISERLKQDSPLTWHGIATALRSPPVNCPDVARHIESWYVSPSLDLQQHSASDSQQHLSLGGDRPYPMLLIGQTRVSSREVPSRDRISVSSREVPSRDRISVSTCSMCGACFRKIIKPVFSCLLCQRGAPHRENSQPTPQMMSQAPVEGPPYRENFQLIGQTQVRGLRHEENYQPPTQMMGQALVRGPPCRENYQPLPQTISHTQMRGPPHGEYYQPPIGQTPVMGPPHGENYQPPISQTPVMGPRHGENYQPPISQTPVMGPPHGDNYQSPIGQTPVMGPPHGEPFALMRGNPYMFLPHHMAAYQTAYPNTPSTTQPYPSAHAQYSTAHPMSPMDTFIHYVKFTYKQSEIEKNLNVLKWPPTPSKIFINLACIDWESVVSKEEADKYTRAMVEDGSVDVIMKKKRNIDFNDIVEGLPTVTALEKVVLVEGAPGVGKSTFAWEFCRRWERGEIAQQYQLVLLLRLRDERVSRAKCLRDLIYHSSESVCQAVVDELSSTFGVNTLIILEGFDELPDSQRKKSSIFLQLLLGQLLLHATVMITSRPWATGALLAQFKHRIFLHVEILGFTEENITKYVTSVFTGEGKKTNGVIKLSVEGPDGVSGEAKKNIDDVMAYIGKYPQIKACMYIPLNAAIVVSIYRESIKSKRTLPTTLTELYQALTQILLLRHLHGHVEYNHQKWNIESFEEVPREVYRQLLDISKIAYDGICRESDSKESIQLIFSDIPDNFETLGLMQSVSQLFMHGQKTSHNFLHLTFQEFLAAFLISTQSSAKQLKHFQRHKDGRLRVVLRFLAGLTKLNEVAPDELRSLLGEPTVEQSNEQPILYCNPMRPNVHVSAHHTNWLFESQNSELLRSLFCNQTASFTFTREMLPLEYYSVGYCIAHSRGKWSLTFDGDTEKENLHMLASGAKTGDDHHKFEVTLKTTYMTPEKMNIVLNGLSPCVEMHLKIPYNCNSLSLPPSSKLQILELETHIIPCILSFSSLEALIIREVQTYKGIDKFLSSTTSLKEFHISSNRYVSEKGMEKITKSLNDNIALPLKNLNIDYKYTFTTTATRCLVQFITRSTTLQYIKICHVTFSAQGLVQLIEALHHCSSLQVKKLEELTFHGRCLEDVINLRHMIRDHPDVQVSITGWDGVTNNDSLMIGHNTSETKASIVSLVLGCSQNTVLNLSNMNFSDALVEIIAQALHDNSTLKELYLSSSCISDAGAIALSQALHHNSTLRVLGLSSNAGIGKEGTHHLVHALTVNTSITTLDGGGLMLSKICEKYATQCAEYITVMDRIWFY